MSEQPINQWNMTTEPSDMMKINTPMPITVAPSPSNQMEVIDLSLIHISEPTRRS